MKYNSKLPKYNKTEFSLVDTNIVKGVAICLLLFHHCFLSSAYEPYRDSINFFPFSEELATTLVRALKLCVGMFVFISGYGLFLSIDKIDFTFKNVRRWIGTRLAKMMSGYYFVYLFVFIVTMIIDQYPINRYWGHQNLGLGFRDMFLDILGLSNLFDTYTLITTWWYMSMIIIFVVIFPLVFKFTQKLKYSTAIVIVLILPRIIGYQGSKSPMSFILALIFGMMFADYKLFEKLGKLQLCKNKKLSNILILLISLLLVVSIFVVDARVNWGDFCEYTFDIAPVIVICFTKLYIARVPYLRDALHFLGKHSMNIYYIHTFIRCTYLSFVVYYFSYSLVIWGILMGLSILLSLLIEWLKKITRYQNLVNKVVKSINK